MEAVTRARSYKVDIDLYDLSKKAVKVGIEALGKKVPVVGGYASDWAIDKLGLNDKSSDDKEAYFNQVMESLAEIGDQLGVIQEGIDEVVKGQDRLLGEVHNLGLQQLLIAYEEKRVKVVNAYGTWSVLVSKLSSPDERRWRS